MKISKEVAEKLENNIFCMRAEDFQELKRHYHLDNKNFVNLINNYLSIIKKKEDIEGFSFLFENLKNEIVDVSPFLASNINKIFIIMIKNKYYKQIAQYSFLLESCANIKVLELLNEFVKNKGIGKFLTSVEVYRIKKLVFELSNKFKKNDVAYKIQLELEKEDLKWLDDIEK
jgi:hypothetical protein